MFGKIIKNKVLSFLLSVAAICPFVSAKDVSKPFESGKGNDIFLKEYASQEVYSQDICSSLKASQTYTSEDPEEDWEEYFETQISRFHPENGQPLDEYTKTLIMDDGMRFYILSPDKVPPTPKLKQLPLSTVKTQELNINGMPWLIVDDNAGPSKARQEMDELLAISADPAQSSEVKSPVDKEKAQKLKGELNELLQRLNSNPNSSQPVIQPGTEQILALDEDLKKITVPSEMPVKELAEQVPATNISETVSVEVAEKIPEKSVEQKAPLSEVSVSPKDEEIPVPAAAKGLHSADSLAELQDLERALESQKNELGSTKNEPEEQPLSRPFSNKTPEEKEIIYTMLGIMVGSLSLVGLSCLPRKYRFEDDYVRSILDEVADKSFSSVEPPKRIILDGVTDTPPSQVASTQETEQIISEQSVVPAEPVIAEREQALPPADSVEPIEQVKQLVASVEQSSAFSTENSQNLFSKSRDDMAEWLIAAKILEEIKKERLVLRKEMALAKKQPDNQEEIDRINARRSVLNAKRRAACLRANSREMQEINKKRRQLTREMAKAKRHDDNQAKERIKAIRQDLRNQVKQMNEQVSSFNYTQNGRSFLTTYRQISASERTK